MDSDLRSVERLAFDHLHLNRARVSPNSPDHPSEEQTDRLSSVELTMAPAAIRSKTKCALLWIFAFVLVLLLAGRLNAADVERALTFGSRKNSFDYLALRLVWPNTLVESSPILRKGLKLYLDESDKAACDHFIIGSLSAELSNSKSSRRKHRQHPQYELFTDKKYDDELRGIEGIPNIDQFWPNLNLKKSGTEREADWKLWRKKWVDYSYDCNLEFGTSKLRLFEAFIVRYFPRLTIEKVWQQCGSNKSRASENRNWSTVLPGDGSLNERIAR